MSVYVSSMGEPDPSLSDITGPGADEIIKVD